MDLWDGEERRAAPRWKLKREVSIGDVLAFISAVTAVLYAYTTLDKRIALLETSTVLQKDTDRRQDEEQIRTQVRVEEAIRGLANKIDQLLMRGANGQVR